MPIPAALFREIGYEDARQQAVAENKPLFIFFDGDWARTRGELIERTLSAPDVMALLRERTVALRVEVVDLPDIAKKYRVTDVPFLVLVAPDGRELGRWSGAPKAAAFADEMKAYLLVTMGTKKKISTKKT